MERTLETGGEVLRVGDTVMVFDGNSTIEAAIVRIGTIRVTLNVSGREIPFNNVSHQNSNGKRCVRYFHTRTEIAERYEQDRLRRELFHLGFQVVNVSSLKLYPNSTLAQVVDLLEQHRKDLHD